MFPIPPRAGLRSALLAVLLAFGSAPGCDEERSTTPETSDGPLPVTISVQPVVETLIIPDRETVQFRAIGGFEDLSTRDVTNEVTWTSTNTAVATVDDFGLARAVGVGNAAIIATLGAAFNSATVDVEKARPSR